MACLAEAKGSRALHSRSACQPVLNVFTSREDWSLLLLIIALLFLLLMLYGNEERKSLILCFKESEAL